MRCLRTLGVLSVTLSLVWSMTLETTSPRPTPQPLINHTTNNASNQVLETNTSTMAFFDVRTPPKVQSQIRDRMSSKFTIEASHAGVAIPMDADIEMLEESTKKTNFYKLERPTTSNEGLSTWILLSGQTSSTTSKPATKKPSIKPIIMKDDKNNETLMLSDKPMKIVKPAFKQRSTTAKPVTASSISSSSIKTTTIRVNTFSPSPKSNTRKPTKLTKVKASLLQSMTNTKLNSSNSTVKPKTTSSSPHVNTSTTNAPTKVSASSLSATSTENPSTTTALINITSTIDSLSASLPIEAKEGELELPSTEETKKKKTQKRKKNKNKKRKPSKSSKEGNNKLKEVESAGTQLYSYLRSEIIPVTVGVSLVGLLVTAGLASYYLQPFAALRRNDPIDRKDTEGNYYYQDTYSNAMPEEDAIGKVIAGMPDNSLQGGNSNTFKQPTSRNTYPQNVRYRHVDRRSQISMNPYGSVEDVKLTDRAAVSYDQSSNYNNNDQKFVVGNVPKEAVPEVTPAVVPEHGPRNLKEGDQKFVVGSIPKDAFSVGASPRNLRIRRTRQVEPNDLENEISQEENEIDLEDSLNHTTTSTAKIETTIATSNDTDLATTEEAAKDTTPHNVFNINERPNTLFELITELFKLKVKLGLELMQNVTNSVSTYVSEVHTKLDKHYRGATRRNSSKHSS